MEERKGHFCVPGRRGGEGKGRGQLTAFKAKVKRSKMTLGSTCDSWF